MASVHVQWSPLLWLTVPAGHGLEKSTSLARGLCRVQPARPRPMPCRRTSGQAYTLPEGSGKEASAGNWKMRALRPSRACWKGHPGGENKAPKVLCVYLRSEATRYCGWCPENTGESGVKRRVTRRGGSGPGCGARLLPQAAYSPVTFAGWNTLLS